MLTEVRLIIRDKSPLCDKIIKGFFDLSKEFPTVKFKAESINDSYSAVVDMQRNGCYNLPCAIKTNEIGVEYCKPIKTLKDLKTFILDTEK